MEKIETMDLTEHEKNALRLVDDQNTSIFMSVARFEFAKKVASMLAASSMVPQHFHGAEGVGNCMIALNLAERLQMDVFGLMQSCYIVHGRPGFEAKFLIGLFNDQTKLFIPPLRFEIVGDDPENQDYKCRAWAKDKETQEVIHGQWVTWKMVKSMGWYEKPGPDKTSKSNFWHTMPGQMFTYRAGSMFINAYEPGLKLGIQTVDELEDSIIDITPKKEIKIEGPQAEASPEMYEAKEMPKDENEQDEAPEPEVPFENDDPIISKETIPVGPETMDEKALYRNEWVNLKQGGYSTFVHKNFARIEENGNKWPDLYHDQEEKWIKLYPKDPWPLKKSTKSKSSDPGNPSIDCPITPGTQADVGYCKEKCAHAEKCDPYQELKHFNK